MYKFVDGMVMNVYKPDKEESHAVRMTSISKEPPETLDHIQALIFDLDNILYPLDSYVQSGFREISRLFPGEEADVYELLWQVFDDQTVWAPLISKQHVTKAIHIMLRENMIYTDEMMEKCLRVFEQHEPQIQPYDKTEEWLMKFRERGLRLGMIIDGPPAVQRAKLRALGIAPLFDEIIITDEIAGNGNVLRFRTPARICFEIMSLRLDVPLDEMRYVSAERYRRHLKTGLRLHRKADQKKGQKKDRKTDQKAD